MISFDTYSESLKHSHQSCAGLIEWFCNFLKTFKEHSSDSTWFSIWFVQSLTLTKFWACTTFHISVSTYRAERLRVKKLHKTMQSKGSYDWKNILIGQGAANLRALKVLKNSNWASTYWWLLDKSLAALLKVN